MLKLASLLGVQEQVYGAQLPTSFRIEVLQFNTPVRVLHSLSLHHALQNASYIAFSHFHTQLSLARQCVQLSKLAAVPAKRRSAFVKSQLVDVKDNHTRRALAHIAEAYSENAMAQIEYVHASQRLCLNCAFSLTCSRDCNRGLGAKLTALSAYRPEFFPVRSSRKGPGELTVQGRKQRRLLEQMLEEHEMDALLVEVCVYTCVCVSLIQLQDTTRSQRCARHQSCSEQRSQHCRQHIVSSSFADRLTALCDTTDRPQEAGATGACQ